jgi:aminopeptidase N
MGVSSFAQTKEEVMTTFRHHELQNWQDAVSGSFAGRGDENIDVKFYHLNLEVSIDSAYILGSVTCQFEPVLANLSQLYLDLHSSLAVDSISSPCESFYQTSDSLVIQLADSFDPGESISLKIYYQGKPVLAAGYKGLRYENHHGDQPIIATLSTPFLAHYWYPCKDGPQDKADSVYIDITTDDRLVNGLPVIAVSNGLLQEVELTGGKRTSKWRHRYPIVPYYVMLAISNYDLIEDVYVNQAGDSIPLDYYVFAEEIELQEAGVAQIPGVIGFFESVFGPYPFANEKYGMSQLGYYGAIENQTNTITNSMAPSWFMVSVHELAHMWFADMITCHTWNHAWLNEGFATYSEALWKENDDGISAYHSEMNSMEFFGGGTLYLENPLDTFNVFTPIIYNKGAWALHMLRGVVGDSLFFRSVKNYATDSEFMYQDVVTEQLKEVFETTCNTNLDYFFEQWIYDEFYPVYHYNFNQESEKLYVMLYQAQEELFGRRPVFEMPVPIFIAFADNSDTTVTVWNNQQLQQFEFDFDKTVSFVYVDIDKWILRQEQFTPELPVGLNESNSFERVSVYPNPTTEKITIGISDQTLLPLNFILYDLNGHQLFSRTITSKNHSQNLSDLNKGLYFYRLTTKNGKLLQNGKIIKSD